MSRFSQRFQTHAVPQLNREHGHDANLRRGRLLTGDLVARKHLERRHEAMGQEIGISVKVERQSWLIPISSCTLNGVAITPQSGDELLVGAEVWEVHAPDDGTPPSEKHRNGYYWVVHTRLSEDG